MSEKYPIENYLHDYVKEALPGFPFDKCKVKEDFLYILEIADTSNNCQISFIFSRTKYKIEIVLNKKVAFCSSDSFLGCLAGITTNLKFNLTSFYGSEEDDLYGLFSSWAKESIYCVI